MPEVYKRFNIPISCTFNRKTNKLILDAIFTKENYDLLQMIDLSIQPGPDHV